MPYGPYPPRRGGKYVGPKLNMLVPRTLVDNRIISVEGIVHKGNQSFYAQSMEDKGFPPAAGEEMYIKNT